MLTPKGSLAIAELDETMRELLRDWLGGLVGLASPREASG